MNGWRRLVVSSCAAAVLLTACGGAGTTSAPAAGASSPAAAGRLRPLTFGIEVTSATQLPAWVALDKGYFKRYGLGVKETLMGTTAKTAAGLLSGSLDMAYLESSATINADAGGGQIVLVGDLLSTFPEWLYGAKGVTSVAQLKGKKVGVPGLGSLGALLVRCALQQSGLNAGRDVVMTPVGGQPEVTAALESGAIQAGAVVPPFTFRAQAAGLKPLAFVGAFKGCPRVAVEIATTRSFLTAHPRRVTDFLKAHMAAIDYLRRNSSFAVSDLVKHTKVSRKVAQEAFGQVAPYFAHPGVLAMSDAGIQSVITYMAATVNRAARSVRPAQILDYTLYQRLIRSGFPKSLK